MCEINGRLMHVTLTVCESWVSVFPLESLKTGHNLEGINSLEINHLFCGVDFMPIMESYIYGWISVS